MTAPATAFIGLGGNLGDAATILRQAMEALKRLPQTRLVRGSRLYRTPAWGMEQQPDFINAAAMVDTSLCPRALLDALLGIERDFGRRRDGAPRWGPRLLDLDLLLYADARIDEPGLTLPHPHLHERAFVLVPLIEIAPDIEIPGHGPARNAARVLSTDAIHPLEVIIGP
jgi:2-amino-4-hydroxy-6-hydroxymethyldihydropteridine diphosphokinase